MNNETIAVPDARFVESFLGPNSDSENSESEERDGNSSGPIFGEKDDDTYSDDNSLAVFGPLV